MSPGCLCRPKSHRSGRLTAHPDIMVVVASRLNPRVTDNTPKDSPSVTNYKR